ncbi:hypothetical protein [Thiohalocapsa sp. ML1]|uniref:hypothetical protein n=1 Tax=Thiohalocapsa sp. ML1 TaxID=1431688 RepID=UPI0007320073|nr:hypothetical protein [Thiohalocapsa sp. ML1]
MLDPDLRELIRALAQRNPGLLLLTSRQALPDLTGHHQHALEELGRDAAIRLLRDLQIRGSDADLAAACAELDCHALSLTLLGRFLFDAHGGDIRCRDRIDWGRADQETRGSRHRTAWKVLEAYEQWLAPPARGWARLLPRGGRRGGSGDSRAQTIAVLRLTGLFDRPASPDSLRVLRRRPAIRGLTEALVDVDETGWESLLARLEAAHLIHRRGQTAGTALDVHPLIREYFAEQLRRHLPKAHAAAHGRLFDYLCQSTPERPDDLPGLQPLYQAVRHGVLAGRAQTALEEVYRDRILRGTGDDGFYSRDKLGAISQDLSAVAAFFDEPWTRVTTAVSEPDRAWLLSEAAINLRALGRLTEALGPMRAGLEMYVQQQDWNNAARSASSLSELEVTLGDLPAAIRDAHASVAHADRSGDAFLRMARRTTAADALHQAGERREAGALFAAAEVMQRERQPQFPLLYSLPGFRYSDWLLAPAERAAWRVLLSFPRAAAGAGTADFQSATGSADSQSASGGDADAAAAPPDLDPLAACDEVERRAHAALEIVLNGSRNLLDIALNHLTLARVAQWRGLLTGAAATPAPAGDPDQPPDPHQTALTAAVTGLREAAMMDHLPKALLTAALSHALRGDPAAARALLDEAWGIAEAGPMPLFQADVLLTRARLWLARPWADPLSRLEAKPAPSRPEAAPTGYPWPERTPAMDLAEARRLIDKHGYARRLPELADVEAALRTADA